MESAGSVVLNMTAAAIALTGLVAAAWWIIGLYWMHSRAVGSKLPHVSLPADLHGAPAGISWALMVFYVFTALSLVGYLLYVWQRNAAY